MDGLEMEAAVSSSMFNREQKISLLWLTPREADVYIVWTAGQ
jgi:hypothetical protein